MNPVFVIAGTCLVGLAIVTFALLKAWGSWLAFKRAELDRARASEPGGSPLGAARIELADLKERIRKLEAIASGVDL
ncbi:MAG: hypothetical protein V2J51_13815 [Erythrobacter sp.]|nr:hypothetical protein [Erythrobacter sp.]